MIPRFIEPHKDVRQDEGSFDGRRYHGDFACKKCARPTCKNKPYCTKCLMRHMPYPERVAAWAARELRERKREGSSG